MQRITDKNRQEFGRRKRKSGDEMRCVLFIYDSENGMWRRR